MKAVASLQIVTDLDKASSLFNATRLSILRELEEPNSATGLAKRLGLTRQQINYHVRQLEEGGFVQLVEERKKRNCIERVVRAASRSYVISPSALGTLGAGSEHVADRASSGYLVGLAAQTIRDVAALEDEAQKSKKRIASLSVHAEVRFASPKDQKAFSDELSSEIARLITKYHDEDVENGRTFRVLAGAYPRPSESTHASALREHDHDS